MNREYLEHVQQPVRIARAPSVKISCPPSFRLVVVGNPTAGSFDMTLTLPGGSGVIVVNWNMTAAQLKTAIEAHTHWVVGYEVATHDGPFPINSLSFSLGGDLDGESIIIPTASNITLSGGARVGVRIERCGCEAL